MLSVQLLFFSGCPHVEAARRQLISAFSAAGLESGWTEHDVNHPETPVELRGYGSPSILVNGRDVMGATPGDGAACRLYMGTDLPGAPPLSELVRALTSR